MIEQLTLDLFDYGILQFGRFADENEIIPINISLGLLASYPKLLNDLAGLVAKQVFPVEKYRLVSPLSSLVVALLVSQKINVPLVFERQVTKSAVSDFVGAYDIGHPTCVIWSTEWSKRQDHFMKRGISVGLHIERMIYIVGRTNTPNVILPLDTMLEILVAHHRIRVVHQANILDWLATKTAL